jgi:hypothetical protein
MDDLRHQPRAVRQLRVDLEELAMALEDASGEISWCLDTTTGDVILVSSDLEVDERAAEIEADESGRYLPIPHADSHTGYEEMQDFIETVQDVRFRELLEVSIQGRGAFRRFRDAVGRDNAELQRWFAYRNQRLEDRARKWLADEGLEPLPKGAS